MNSIDLPRRQFLGQTGALVTSAAVLNSSLRTQAFAAHPAKKLFLGRISRRPTQGSPEALSTELMFCEEGSKP